MEYVSGLGVRADRIIKAHAADLLAWQASVKTVALDAQTVLVRGSLAKNDRFRVSDVQGLKQALRAAKACLPDMTSEEAFAFLANHLSHATAHASGECSCRSGRAPRKTSDAQKAYQKAFQAKKREEARAKGCCIVCKRGQGPVCSECAAERTARKRGLNAAEYRASQTCLDTADLLDY